MLILSACPPSVQIPVTIKDEPLYYLKEADSDQWAVEMHFLSAGQTQVSEESWDSISQGMVCMPLSAWADINTEIGKLCTQEPCDYQSAFQALIARFEIVSGQKLH